MHPTHGGRAILLLGGTSILLAAVPGHAQSQDVVQVADIVVTAQKREQKLQDVPLSISPITAAEIQQRQVQSLRDYVRTVPGIAFVDGGPTGQRGGPRQIFARGIAPSTGGATVDLYVDEVNLLAGDPKLFDLERVEVLKGPQGTLYGRGTAGGTIKYITRQPVLDKLEGAGEAILSQTEGGGTNYQLQGALNLPIINDRVALRVSGTHQRNSGYVDFVGLDEVLAYRPDFQQVPTSDGNAVLLFNPDELNSAFGLVNFMIARPERIIEKKDVNTEKTTAVRAALTIHPIEELRITPAFFYQKTRVANQDRSYIDIVGPFRQVGEVETPQRETLRIASLTAEGDLGPATITWVTAYQRVRRRAIEDITPDIRAAALNLDTLEIPPLGAAAPSFAGTDRLYTQEIRLASNGDGPLQWIIGGFFYDRTSNAEVRLVMEGVEAAGLPAPGDLLLSNRDRRKETEFASFGEVSYRPRSDLEFAVGLRYFNVKQTSTGKTQGLFGSRAGDDPTQVFPVPDPSDALNNPEGLTRLSAKGEGLRPKFRISYQPSDDALVYASAAQGFRRGGFNQPVPGTPGCSDGLNELGFASGAPRDFDADSIWNYEAGVKTSWFGNRLTLNGAIFYVDWSKIVQAIGIPGCPGGFSINGGKARSRGFELEINATPVDGLSLQAGIAYTDAELRSNTEPGANPNPDLGLRGDRILNTPDWTVGANINYEFPVQWALRPFVGAEFQYVGERQGNYLVDDPAYRFGSYKNVNVRLGVQHDRFRATLFVNNVFDVSPVLGSTFFGSIGQGVTTLRPRTIGVNLSSSF
jgi:outer membrane receptor protein involved in Fe transport